MKQKSLTSAPRSVVRPSEPSVSMKQRQEEAQLEKTVECWKTRRDHFISQFHFYSCCRGEATPTGYTSVTHCRAEGYVSCRSSDN